MAAFDLLVFLATSGMTRSRLTTALLVVAVAAGVGLQIPNTANLLGYTAGLFEEATTRGFGDVRVQSRAGPVLDDGDALARDLAGLPSVRGTATVLTLPGAIGHDVRQEVAEVHGVDPAGAYRPYRIHAGENLAPDDEEGVLVGATIAAHHDIHVGDRVEVRVLLPAPPPPPGAALEEVPQPTLVQLEMPVRGLAAGTFGASTSLFVTRGRLARAMARPHAATRVLLYTRSHAGESGVSTAKREGRHEADALARVVEARRRDLLAVTWMSDHPYADSAIQANEVLGIVSHTMVVIAVTIPIVSLLYVTVLNRRRDIAMLVALGFTRLDVFFAFILQSLAVGATGALLGCGLGWVAIRWFDAYPIFDSADFSVRPATSAAGFYEPALVVLLATVGAAVYPALRAARIDPARVLRGVA
jgi:ABC-type lipoprotein release transport system permease subunit